MPFVRSLVTGHFAIKSVVFRRFLHSKTASHFFIRDEIGNGRPFLTCFCIKIVLKHHIFGIKVLDFCPFLCQENTCF